MSENGCSEKGKCRLARCDIESCEAMCCYDGAYLLEGEERYLNEIVAFSPEDFQDLPGDFLVDGYWEGRFIGRKTAVKPHSYRATDYPTHFAATRCVFADEKGFCKLQKLGEKVGIHPWTFKPSACWLFPLKIADGRPVPPPKNHAEDPDRTGSRYPGFTTCARCGRHREDGELWSITLAEELRYFEENPKVPVWANSGLSVPEIIEKQRARRWSTA